MDESAVIAAAAASLPKKQEINQCSGSSSAESGLNPNSNLLVLSAANLQHQSTTSCSSCSSSLSGPNSLGSNASSEDAAAAASVASSSVSCACESECTSDSIASTCCKMMASASSSTLGSSSQTATVIPSPATSSQPSSTTVVDSGSRINNNNNSTCNGLKATASAPALASMVDVAGLHGALASLQEKLTQKDIEIARLSRIREDVEAELEDLTASLFEEAHRMVREALVKQTSAEKGLVEARMKIDGLETEVAALKTLVLTSTPSQPNKHLHPQLDPKNNKRQQQQLVQNSSSESVNGLENGGASGSSRSSSRQCSPMVGAKCNSSLRPSASPSSAAAQGTQDALDEDDESQTSSYYRNIDPAVRKDYLSWKDSPSLDPSHPFLSRIYREDIDLCLDFPNKELCARVVLAIKENSLCLSPVKDYSNLPRCCALLETPVLCKYILVLSEEGDTVLHISQLARNRLAAVCDCLSYFRYIHQGLVKTTSSNDVYWEIMRLRKQMVVARLGFSPD